MAAGGTGNFDSLMASGIERFNAGDIAAARSFLKRALKLDRRAPEALHVIGLCHHLEGQSQLAIKSIKKALSEGGPNAEVLNNLGQIQAEAGKHADAARSYTAALKIAPETPAILNNLASSLAALGKNDDAIGHYRRAIDLDPGYAQAHYNLGTLLLETGAEDCGVSQFKTVLEIAPDYIEAYNNLAFALIETEPEDALGYLDKALSIDPSYIDAIHNKGIALANLGRSREALSVLEQAQGAAPDRSDILTSLAGVHRALGEFDLAEAIARQALACDPQCAKAYYLLGSIERFDDVGNDLRAMKALNKKGVAPDEARADLHYALFMALDRTDDTTGAFSNLKAGNDLLKKTAAFDISAEQTVHDWLKAEFSEARISEAAGIGVSSGAPIFIVGMPRSGSTLIEQILSSHPDIHGVGESQELLKLSEPIYEQMANDPGFLAQLSSARRAELGQAYLAGISRSAGNGRRVVDKQLRNYQNIGLINLLLPNARIIHARRSALSICFSAYKYPFASKIKYSYNLSELGQCFRLYADLMEHWSQASAIPILDVDYEKLVANQEPETRRILDYCGLEWDDAVLDFHKTEREIGTASVYQVRQPLYASSLKQWERYREHLGPLFEALGNLA